MKLTNEQMGNYIDVMANCHETGKLGYAIARNTRKMNDASKEYLDLRAKLFQEYGTVNGQTVSIDKVHNPEGFKAYMEEMGDIPQIESDVDIYLVDEDTFCSGHLTSGQMTQLLWMVKEGE